MARASGKDGRRRHRLARRFSFLTLLAFAGLAALATPQGREWASKGLRDAAWVEKQIRLRLGLPLRGTPDLARFEERLAEKGLRLGDPIFIRIFKQESEVELWMKKGERFVPFATYPICRWSGMLGPKVKEGDRQSPEGFYTVASSQLNPNSRWHRSFNLGYPNRFDRAHGRTGSFLMVHGGCGSIGCYAMTNPVIDEIWRLVTAALRGGQARFPVHVFPFRMTGWNMALHAGREWDGFWGDLKVGYDLFEETRVPPLISVCDRRYVARAGSPGSDGSRTITQECQQKVSRN
jgi:murein L,D-transpeptidase YafK